MSGMPTRSPIDASKFKENYMANLALQAGNNQKNMNANRIFKSTGQTPNQPDDARTATEKLADVEGLKTQVRSFLTSAGFTNSTNANTVATDLTPREREFVIQYKLFIATDFKGRGVPAPVLYRYLIGLRDKTIQTQNVDFGLQQATGQAILASTVQILNHLVNRTDIDALLQLLGDIEHNTRGGPAGGPPPAGGMNDPTNVLLQQIRVQLHIIEDLIPTREDLAAIHNLPAPRQAGIQERMGDIMEAMPSAPSFSSLTTRLQQAFDRGDRPSITQNLRSLLPQVSIPRGVMDDALDLASDLGVAVEEERMDEEATLLHNAPPPPSAVARAKASMKESGEKLSLWGRNLFKRNTSTATPTGYESVEHKEEGDEGSFLEAPRGGPAETKSSYQPSASPYKFASEEEQEEKPAQKYVPPPTALSERPKKLSSAALKGEASPAKAVRFTGDITEDTSPEEIADAQQIKTKLQNFLYDHKSEIPEIRTRKDTFIELDELKAIHADWFGRQKAPQGGQPAPAYKRDAGSSQSGATDRGDMSSSGNGLKKRLMGRGLVKNHINNGHIDGVFVKPKPYKPFGRLLINRHKLDNGIVMLHRPSGVGLKELPTHKASEKVTAILKMISNGVIPHHDHLEGLGVKEKEHLCHICHHARIEGMPNLKTHKGTEEKENDRFDILKGEILAGNDNKTLIREFKVLLMKFLQAGRIPRREAHEILVDLTSMGF